MWHNLLFGGTAAIFLAMTVASLFHLRWAWRLPSRAELEPNSSRGKETPTDPGTPAVRTADAGRREKTSVPAAQSSLTPAAPVLCSVVLAARDEETRIENTIRRLLAQEGVRLEVIVVDDRSQDGTPEILRRLGKESACVTVKRVEVLPEGWLGKCHACHVGASVARGDWILFTDADCWLKPDVIVRALLVAERECADHVTLTPGVRPASPGGRAWHLAFLLTMADWISGVNRDRPQKYLGMGAFNLMRVAAYRECGGYEALRLTVLDDVKLGLLLRRAGKRTRAFIGGSDAECHWGATAPDMVRVMEKNYFAALEYRTSMAVGLGIGGMLFWGVALAGPLIGGTAGIAAGAAMLSLSLPAGILARRLGWSWLAAALTPFIYPALFYAVLNSAFVTLRQGGVRWRDTFYPLKTLRAGTVR